MNKSIVNKSTQLADLLTSRANYDTHNWVEAAVNTLMNFLRGNHKTITMTMLKKVCRNAYHFDKAKDVCSIVALMNRKYVKGFTLADAYSEKNKTHLVLPCRDKNNKRHGYLLINREAFSYKAA